MCNHPVVQRSPALALFLTAEGSTDLVANSSWQHMLAGLRGGQDAARPSGSSNPAAAAAPAAASSSSSSAASAGGAGLMLRMKASLMSVVQHKAPHAELSADEQQLQQAKAALKCVLSLC